KKRGITVLTTDEFFPSIQRVQTMHLPMRFITTKTEFDEISKSSGPRTLIEKFWIESAGDKDQARALIRTYYNRVEEANHAFTTYTEGWKTDRGMIHIIFGNPQHIDRTAQQEVWDYGENPQIGIVRFVFKRKPSPFSDDVYVLQRSADYRYAWERLVLLWRQGKIYSD
ncbi:MAG: GWxTD domain-containing protein, partial [Flavobacteriales bacterium]